MISQRIPLVISSTLNDPGPYSARFHSWIARAPNIEVKYEHDSHLELLVPALLAAVAACGWKIEDHGACDIKASGVGTQMYRLTVSALQKSSRTHTGPLNPPTFVPGLPDVQKVKWMRPAPGEYNINVLVDEILFKFHVSLQKAMQPRAWLRKAAWPYQQEQYEVAREAALKAARERFDA